MPIYEYECEACGHKLEVMQRITEDPLKTCPSCTEDSLRKLISRVGFQLKGTGWYETDFKHKGKPKPGNGDGKDAGEAGAGSSAPKTDTGGEARKADAGKSASTSSSSAAD